jgi:hypothetical protein
MKLSEAAREGMKRVPKKVKGTYIERDRHDLSLTGKACILGTIALGAGCRESASEAEILCYVVSYFPELNGMHWLWWKSSAMGEYCILRDLLITLNDDLDWSKLHMIEWLEAQSL